MLIVYISRMPRLCASRVAATPTAATLASFATLSAGVLAGCVSVADRGDDALLAGRVPLQAFTPTNQHGPELDFPSPPDAKTTAISRENWPTTYFLVPAREVVHQPVYTTDAPGPKLTARQRQEFAQLSDAGDVHVSRANQLAQAKQGALAPLYAAADVVMLIPRAIMQAPDTQVRSGISRARVPGLMPGVTSLTPPVFPEVPPAPVPTPVVPSTDASATATPPTVPANGPTLQPTPPVGEPPATLPGGIVLPQGVTPAKPEPQP